MRAVVTNSFVGPDHAEHKAVRDNFLCSEGDGRGHDGSALSARPVGIRRDDRPGREHFDFFHRFTAPDTGKVCGRSFFPGHNVTTLEILGGE